MYTAFPNSWKELLQQDCFTQPTPIQEHVFSAILNKESVLGISPTGTGKTLAYLWPCLLSLQPKKAQQLLILSPNTELAGQIFDVCKTWSDPLGLSPQLLLSGSSQKRQIDRLKKGPEILIGTPGRIFELIKLKKIKMMSVETIVLDEFDELLNDSQFHFVHKILNHVPKNHQLIYMSATSKFDSTKIPASTRRFDLSDQHITGIEHCYIQVDKRDRIELLRKFSTIPDFRAITFFHSLSDLGAAEEKLLYRQSTVVSLASDINIKFRKLILERFKNQEISLLLATDLVARGIDIKNLECVINFELPRDKEQYTHRAGRTGRMGNDGIVITLISNPNDLKTLKKYASVTEIILKNQKLYKI